MTEIRRRATAADVAKRSGVSGATVSYVLNNKPGQTIPESTRNRVLAAAEDLGYVPSALAQALARGRTGVVIIDLSEVPHGEGIARFGRKIAQALDSRGYIPILDQPQHSSGTSHTRLLSLSSLFAPSIVISATPLPEPIRARLASEGVQHQAALLSDGDLIEGRVDAAARAQVEYLSSRGHHTIGYCGTSAPHLAALDQVRRSAVLRAGESLGLRAIDLGSHQEPTAVAYALSSALSANSRLSAVAAYNDEVAFATLAAAHRLQLAVPTDLAVIGIDDIPLASSAYPSLTSVGYDDDAGYSPDEFIDSILSGTPRHPRLSVRVFKRESA